MSELGHFLFRRLVHPDSIPKLLASRCPVPERSMGCKPYNIHVTGKKSKNLGDQVLFIDHLHMKRPSVSCHTFLQQNYYELAFLFLLYKNFMANVTLNVATGVLVRNLRFGDFFKKSPVWSTIEASSQIDILCKNNLHVHLKMFETNESTWKITHLHLSSNWRKGKRHLSCSLIKNTHLLVFGNYPTTSFGNRRF